MLNRSLVDVFPRHSEEPRVCFESGEAVKAGGGTSREIRLRVDAIVFSRQFQAQGVEVSSPTTTTDESIVAALYLSQSALLAKLMVFVGL